MGRHEGWTYHRIRRAIAAVSLALLVTLAIVGVLFMLPSGDKPQATPALAPVPTTVAPQEHHIAIAMETPAGQAAQNASNQVTRDRQAASDNQAARAVQDRLDQAMGGPVMFGPDTAMLTPYGETQVARIVDVLRASPGARVEIVGHTAVEIADPPLCLQLSQLRAEQVATRIAMAGIDPHQISAIGVSHMQAKDTAAESRRVELIVL